jgi:hypothetical protein
MAVTMFVVARGVERGLEQAVRFMVPALVVIMLILLGYAMNTGAFQQGFAFLFKPDFAALTGNGVLAAMGQAFFSLSIGMAAVMAYGAYLPQQTSIIGTSVAVVCADTAIAILAGLVIFPIVFANGLDPNAGPGLIFETLPLAFGQLPGGAIFGALFFLLLAPRPDIRDSAAGFRAIARRRDLRCVVFPAAGFCRFDVRNQPDGTGRRVDHGKSWPGPRAGYNIGRHNYLGSRLHDSFVVQPAQRLPVLERDNLRQHRFSD